MNYFNHQFDSNFTVPILNKGGYSRSVTGSTCYNSWGILVGEINYWCILSVYTSLLHSDSINHTKIILLNWQNSLPLGPVIIVMNFTFSASPWLAQCRVTGFTVHPGIAGKWNDSYHVTIHIQLHRLIINLAQWKQHIKWCFGRTYRSKTRFTEPTFVSPPAYSRVKWLRMR